MDHLDLGITYIDLMRSEVAGLAVERLINQVNSFENRTFVGESTIPAKLIIKDSTGAVSPQIGNRMII